MIFETALGGHIDTHGKDASEYGVVQHVASKHPRDKGIKDQCSDYRSSLMEGMLLYHLMLVGLIRARGIN